MIKKIINIFACFFLFANLSLASFEFPKQPESHINDYANVLSQEAKVALEKRFINLEAKLGIQAAVAIFPNISPLTIEDAAHQVFNTWKLGDQKRKDGILLVLSIKERAVRIEVGYGLEAKIPDALAGRIIKQDMTPFLKSGQYMTAIAIFEDRVEKILSDKSAESSMPDSGLWDSSTYLIIMFLAFALFLFIIPLLARRTTHLSSRGKRTYNDSYWGPDTNHGDSGSSGFSGFGGGGGFSGGGGDSGGGGASGRW